jgi:hypothetical protein
LADISRFDGFLKAAAERKKPRRDFKDAMREFAEYRRSPELKSEKSEKSEKPKKPGKPENLKQPEKDFLV